MLSKTLQLGAAGSGAAEGTYVEDVFSTQLYTGTGSNQTITNGVDLAGEGGLIWTKWRSGGAYTVESHALLDTERGATKLLQSDTTGAQSNVASYFNFNSDGYEITTSSSLINHSSGGKYASWSFRKAPGFFDVVTYTGTGVAGRTVSHNLGSVPGFIMVKELSTASNWICYHRSTGNGYALYLNNTEKADGPNKPSWNQTSPTSTEFTVGVDGYHTNDTNITYVAYLFAHDEPIFGADEDQSIVKCGSYTGNGNSTGPEINLGWEPQWLLVKRAGQAGNWVMFDSMRGVATGGADAQLFANLTSAEGTAGDYMSFTSTGFQPTTINSSVNASAEDYIYIAIRRGPMKVPEDATTVFAVNTSTNDNNFNTTGFPVDAAIQSNRAGDATHTSLFGARLQGTNVLRTGLTNSEVGYLTADAYTSNTQFRYAFWGSGSFVNYALGRAPGFFDVVAYTGTGSATTVNHNLGVVPELMVVKKRNAAVNWVTYTSTTGSNAWIILNADAGAITGTTMWNNTTPTSTVFSLANSTFTNANGDTYIAYLFASCPGVSKVGSYTGTGSNLSVNCGFAGGARFVLIKRTDSTGDWWVFDTARGIVSSGNDPALRLNLTNPEVTSTDYLEPNSNGFTVTSTAGAGLNANGGSYIYLAIA